jgi:SAM-dependent methyltransferase
MTSYLHGHAESVLRSHSWRTAENSAGYLLPHLRAGLDLLDVGCGPGTITLDLAAQVAPGRVLGIDAVEAPLIGARELAAGSPGLAVRFEVGDAYALSLPDDSVDVAHAHQTLQHLADPVAALREMARVTRPGGLVAVRDADYAAMTWWPKLPALDRWLELYFQVAAVSAGEPEAGRRLLSWAQAAGLTDMVASTSSWCFATPADREWWGGSWADRAVASSYATTALEHGPSTQAELEQISAAFREWTAAPDGWWAVLHGEVLARV